MPRLWNKKSIAALQAEPADVEIQELMTDDGVPLKRTLSATSLVALGIGNVIGAGIFVVTGQAAAAHAGPAIGLSFLISAIACAFSGMCHAEMASSVPISGSASTYASQHSPDEACSHVHSLCMLIDPGAGPARAIA